MISEYLRSDNKKSSMRLALIICVICGGPGCIILAGVDLFINQGRNIASIGVLSATILTPAFGGKFLQKKDEIKETEKGV